MWSLEAFQERKTVTTITPIDAVPTQLHFTSGEDLRIGKYNRLIGLCCLAYAPGNAYVTSPSLRAFSRIYIAPMVYTRVLDYKYNYQFNDRSRNPSPLEAGEALNAFLEAPDNLDDDDIIGVWLADAPVSPVFGDIRTIHAYCTGTYPQLAWTYDGLTFTPDLPTGRYAIVGARAYMTAATGLVRFVFPDQHQRPGLIALTEQYNMTTDKEFRMGYLGVWGEFESNNPPGVEILPERATTDCYMRIDVMRIR